ncbi:MAG: Regulatory protein AtoC [Verrucomicrobiae bacterium]|nr:Regulatory protein AtoC [Verrucomicrobiae bacterium]
MAKARILIIDDEESPRESLRFILKDRYDLTLKETGTTGLAALRGEGPFDVVLLDMKMPDMSGLDVLGKVPEVAPGTPVVMITAITEARPAVQAMKMGAADYLNKPFDVQEIRLVVERVIKERAERQQVLVRPAVTAPPPKFDNIIGNGPAMQRVYELIRRLKDTETTVLITGETGTGKELVARALHFNSLRKEQPFVPVHCAAIPGELLESELFGHEKGSFTGAFQRRIGMFEAASGGTLFLDEIGEMPVGTQTKLLRAIQEREIRRVGGQETIHINVRLVCATNRNLEQEVKRGSFREDLFYRINVVPILLPSLRERREDIAALVRYFNERFAKDLNRTVPELTPAALEMLVNYPWPGNVRELQHAIERLLVTCDDPVVDVNHLPFVISQAEAAAPAPATVSQPAFVLASGLTPTRGTDLGERLEFQNGRLDLPKLTDDIERRAIEEALRRTDGVITEAARTLNITRRMLRYKMDKLGIHPWGDDPEVAAPAVTASGPVTAAVAEATEDKRPATPVPDSSAGL